MAHEQKRELNLRFADESSDELIEYPSAYAMKDDRPKPINYKLWDKTVTFGAEHKRKCIRAAANARRIALDLAEGVGQIGDPEDTETFTVQKAGVRDDRRRPLVWEEDYCLIYTEPDDGMASFGRVPHPADCRFIPRKTAVLEFKSKWIHYDHYGRVPEFKCAGTVRAAPCITRATTSTSAASEAPKTPLTGTAQDAFKKGLITEAQLKQATDFMDWIKRKKAYPLPETSIAKDTEAAETCAVAEDGCPVKLWLIDTGCGHDLVARRELKALRRLIREAKIPLNFFTANGEVPANEAIDLFVRELGEEIEPYVLEETPAVLSVGMRCMKMGYTFIWPPGECPYFITPSGKVIQLEVRDDIPYIKTGSEWCKARKAKGSRQFACPSSTSKATGEEAEPGRVRKDSAGPQDDRVRKDSVSEASEPTGAGGAGGAEPGGHPGPGGEHGDVPPPPSPHRDEQDVDLDPELMDEEEADRRLPETKRDRLRREATSLKHRLLHKPKNPYCEACTRGKMRLGKLFKGSYQRKPDKWGQCITCDHIVSKEDNMLSIKGHRDCLTIKDLWSGLKHCYATYDKGHEQAIKCMQHFIGDRICYRVYSDNSGEIGKALKTMKLMPENSQPGRHENNAIIERENQDFLGGIRT